MSVSHRSTRKPLGEVTALPQAFKFTEFTEATNVPKTDGISKHRLSPYTSTIYITNITFCLMFPIPTVN